MPPYYNDEYSASEKAGEGYYPSHSAHTMQPPAYDDVNRTYANGQAYGYQNANYTQGSAYANTSYSGTGASPGPSGTSSGGGSGGMLGMLKNVAPGQSIASLLDPPPPQFLRARRPDLYYGPFEPAALTSLDAQLDKGFPPLPPPATTAPHPFVTHDVADDDWQRFLHDVRVASSLSPVDKIKAGVTPVAMNIGLMGMLVSKGIEKRMRNKKSDAIGELIEHWNAHFFHPRQITVVLAQGAMSYSGLEGVPPPDMAQYSAALAHDDEFSSDSSDEGVRQGGLGGLGGRRERRGALRERRQARREERTARRGQRKDKRKNRHELWRLVIAYKPARGY
ncbi:hypothetical protein DAEQUDRAFT_813448 [Daedalea quercina L-15889]|uniref:Uncharacterized protein n=1 Tax=Daedalea quercina L-15889 TaxID=1314783 RepID=A0A165N8K3_9APHY|nr:hypothetical protein DAEQUDRAFT_813448 [Daedalea quercina L-15889]